ncbi:MAG: hypothetical protein DLM59_11535 [Pseudonocardiales bacterium]|nr:MAG: hypothetical protein DLM59_11535 [Pseudonocardiales bacterium]
MSQSESRDRLYALLRTEVLKSQDEFDRACLLYDAARVVYDTTKMTFADRGYADTDERASLAQVSDQALEHQDRMVAYRTSGPRTAQEQQRSEHLMEELAAARRDPAEAFQRQVMEPQPDDEDLVALTKFQAQKCAVIIEAWAAKGNELWRDGALAVAQYLSVLTVPEGCIVPTPQQAWATIEALPWPPPTTGRQT